jgi:hypothetical protein
MRLGADWEKLILGAMIVIHWVRHCPGCRYSNVEYDSENYSPNLGFICSSPMIWPDGKLPTNFWEVNHNLSGGNPNSILEVRPPFLRGVPHDTQLSNMSIFAQVMIFCHKTFTKSLSPYYQRGHYSLTECLDASRCSRKMGSIQPRRLRKIYQFGFRKGLLQELYIFLDKNHESLYGKTSTT